VESRSQIIETAQALELTETNVKTRLLRARMKLREELILLKSLVKQFI